MEQRFEQLQMVLDEMGLTVEATEMGLQQMENIQECLEQVIRDMSVFPETAPDAEIPLILETLDTLKRMYTALHFIHHLIHDYHNRVAEEEEESGYKPMTTDELLADYGRWVGQCSLKAASPSQLTPKEYIDEFLSMAWTLASTEVRPFLEVFYTEGDVAYWMEQYMWRDDPDDIAFTAQRDI